MPISPTTAREGLRVSIRRTEKGRIARYHDPDTGKPLTKSEAIRRMTFDEKRGVMTDSFGATFYEGEARLIRNKETPGLLNVRQVSAPLNKVLSRYKPAPNEEIIERLVVAGSGGKVHKIDISYGQGEEWTKTGQSKAWYGKMREALDLPEGERMSTDDLHKAILSRQYVVRRTF